MVRNNRRSMKLFVVLLILSIIVINSSGTENVTKFHRQNIFLSRRKRYLQWPKGSNFVINFTCSKPLLRYQPLTWNTVYEMDVPFAVPPDNKIFFNPGKKTKRHVLERKYFLEHLDDFMTIMGLDGKACIKRLLRESEEFIQTKERSMFRSLIKVLFRSFLNDEEFAEYNDEHDEGQSDTCPISLLEIFMNSSNNEQNVSADSSNYVSASN